MNKTLALSLFDSSIAQTARVLGVSYQSVRKWPDPLPPRIADRVIAALVRAGRPVPSELLNAPPLPSPLPEIPPPRVRPVRKARAQPRPKTPSQALGVYANTAQNPQNPAIGLKE